MKRRPLGFVAPWLVLGLLAVATGRAAAQDPDLEFFEAKVRPVFAERCAKCHAIAKPKGGLRIDSRAGLLAGGASGPAIVPGAPEKSLLVTAIHWTDETLKMPPKERLPDESVAAIEEWIRRGAKMPASAAVAPVATHWAFEPVHAPAIPRVNDGAWVRDPLDAFVLAKLEAKGLHPSKEADRRTLIRRASFDLVGLPPSREEVDAFLADTSPEAFAKVVDRLLASPHFGERWGRHWLDVARYADTKGYVFNEERRYPYAYVYRDWVVRAFNEDLPYDRFLTEQIAADLLPHGEDRRSLAALGFLTLGRRFLNSVPDIIDDRIDVVTRGTMALTVSCARCHDHKFDPIPTRDYYSLYGVFASAQEPARPPLLDEKPPETPQYAAYLRERTKREKEVSDFLARRHGELVADLRSTTAVARYLQAARDPRDAEAVAHEKDLSAHLVRRWRHWLEASRVDPDLAAFHERAKEKDADPAELARLLEGKKVVALEIPVAEIEHVFDGKDRESLQKLRNQVAELDASHEGAPPRAPCVEEGPHPFAPRVFKRGNQHDQGEAVPRRFVSVLAPGGPEWKTSGRLELARAIASRENPLTARVFVNRALLHLLGAPLVRTPSDFGLRSEPPSNPELLDHLAARFAADWSVKRLLRAVVLSATYRQCSDDDPAARSVDPENLLLWRANRKRLDFEALRDALLAVSGRLDRTVGGRAVDLAAPRRTLYVSVDRQNLAPTFRTFDFASPDATSPGRSKTTVPQQALFFMNSRFAIEAARGLAARAPSIDDLYAVALGRAPTDDDRALATEFLETAHVAPSVAWSYGYGSSDGTKVRFTKIPHWTGQLWQGGPRLPDKELRWALIHPTGGRPGFGEDRAVIRRFTAPIAGTLAITGKIAHAQKQGDGIRARIVSSEQGLLGSWELKNESAEVALYDVKVRRGTTIDFVVDGRADENADIYTWVPRIRLADGAGEWDGERDFHGPLDALSAHERLAQVLLETNEFIFED